MARRYRRDMQWVQVGEPEVHRQRGKWVVRQQGYDAAMNWRGRPLTSYRTIVELIAGTTTTKGLKVHADLDERHYPRGVKVNDKELAAVPLSRHDWHGDWNYTVRLA